VVTSAEKTLGKLRALLSLGQEINILHLNVGSAMPKSWSVTYSDKPSGRASLGVSSRLGPRGDNGCAAEKSRLAEWHLAWLEKLIKFFGFVPS
jgi:hypothetical protein